MYAILIKVILILIRVYALYKPNSSVCSPIRVCVTLIQVCAIRVTGLSQLFAMLIRMCNHVSVIIATREIEILIRMYIVCIRSPNRIACKHNQSVLSQHRATIYRKKYPTKRITPPTPKAYHMRHINTYQRDIKRKYIRPSEVERMLTTGYIKL